MFLLGVAINLISSLTSVVFDLALHSTQAISLLSFHRRRRMHCDAV